jgi:hypothetical protein
VRLGASTMKMSSRWDSSHSADLLLEERGHPMPLQELGFPNGHLAQAELEHGA